MAGVSAGGPPGFESFKYNPAAQVTVGKACTVLLTLEQRETRGAGGAAFYGLYYLFVAEDGGPPAAEPTLVLSQTQTNVLELPPKAGVDYRFTVCGWKPGHCAPLWLNVSAANDASLSIAGPLPPPTGFDSGARTAMAAIPAGERPSCYVSGERANEGLLHHHTPHGFIFAPHYAAYTAADAESCEECQTPMTGNVVVSKKTGKKFCSAACANAWTKGHAVRTKAAGVEARKGAKHAPKFPVTPRGGR